MKATILWRVMCILLLFTLLSTHLSTGLAARYTSNAAGSDSARVAKFVFNSNWGDAANHDRDVIINTNGTPANAVVYSSAFAVTVSNSNGSAASEVTIGYTYKITLPEALPAGMTIYLGNSDNPADGVTEFTASADRMTYTCAASANLPTGAHSKADYIFFGANSQTMWEEYYRDRFSVNSAYPGDEMFVDFEDQTLVPGTYDGEIYGNYTVSGIRISVTAVQID